MSDPGIIEPANSPINQFSPIDEVLAEIALGKMIILVDDPNRENEGDIVVPAEFATPEAINFLMRNACGLVCLSMEDAICDRLGLDPVSNNQQGGSTLRSPRALMPEPGSPPVLAHTTAPGPWRWP